MEKVNGNVKANIINITLTKEDDATYWTVNLELNQKLKKFKDDGNGNRVEDTTRFLSMPVAAFLSNVKDEVINYYVANKGITIDILKNCFSDAEIVVSQTVVAAGETYKDYKNEKDYDIYFNEIVNIKTSKVTIIKIATDLQVSVTDLMAVMKQLAEMLIISMVVVYFILLPSFIKLKMLKL